MADDEPSRMLVPLSYEEICHLIRALHWGMTETKTGDAKELIERLRVYQRLAQPGQ